MCGTLRFDFHRIYKGDFLHLSGALYFGERIQQNEQNEISFLKPLKICNLPIFNKIVNYID